MGMVAVVATPSYAQDVPADEDSPTTLQSEPEVESGQNAEAGAQGDTANDPTITITGSRIRRPNLESTVPITSIGGDEFFETGRQSVGDVLNDLPSLRSTFSTQNFNLRLGVAGLNLLDLRGLGTARTLVLQNGRRHVAGDVLSSGISTDINTIPADLIERVDIVTGGNSAIYGSDALAGVVNFILKRNFEGVQVRGQASISKFGDAGIYTGSVVAGTNFAEDRGNVAVNVQFSRQNDYFASNRPWAAQQNVFVTVDTDPGGTPNGSDGNPDAIFFRDVRSTTTSLGGLIAFPADASGFTRPYLFQPDGTLVPETGTRVGIAPNGSFIGGNGISGREGNQLAFSPDLERITVNALGHFTMSEAFEPFFEAKYSRLKTVSIIGSAAFIPAFGFTRERISINNAFLSPQARATILGFTPTATSFIYRGRFNDLGPRIENALRETYRGVVGVRGTFNDDWTYEVAANYGEMHEKVGVEGNLNLQRLYMSLDAVRDSNNNIVCRATIDPAARIPFEGAADEALANQLLAADVAACVPANFFGRGNLSQAAKDYLLQNTNATGSTNQLVLSGFVSGDSSSFFELPGGPIGFAVGAEYRSQDIKYDQDPLVFGGLTFYNSIPTLDPPKFEVKELYGEIRIPLLKDMPFFHELTLSAAGRVADYKGGTGTVFAYNAGADWAPVRDLRFRGNWSHAVRAPSQGELFSQQGQNFAPGFVDPCSARNVGTGAATRAANCLAAGIPATYDFVYLQSIEIVSGGNPNLHEESSDSLTLGAVLQPRFLPGFSLSVDYYDITIDDVITAPTAQQIANACYDAPDLNNSFCPLFQRAGAAGGPRGEINHQILEGTLLQLQLNYAKLTARGIDFEMTYRHKLESVGTISSRLIYTRVLERTSFTDPAIPTLGNRSLSELGDPQDAFNWDIALKRGPFEVAYKMRYIGKMVTNQYEDFFSFQGRPPQNADRDNVRFYSAALYHNARIGIDVGDNFNFYMGVDNITNRHPQLDLTGAGAGSSIYDVRGRSYYAGAVAKF
jgi:outer membrane receptor protein involved in Fe transport